MFVDKQTAPAIMDARFDTSKLERCLGGGSDWVFDYEEYAQQMQSVPRELNTCFALRQQAVQRQ